MISIASLFAGRSFLSSRQGVVALAASVLVVTGCGGGGNESGPPESVVLSQQKLTVKGATGECAVGVGPTVFVFGGNPPYRLSNSVPTQMILEKSEVPGSGDGFSIRFMGGCLDNMPIVVEDRMGRMATLSVSNVKGRVRSMAASSRSRLIVSQIASLGALSMLALCGPASAGSLWVCRDSGGVEQWIGNAGPRASTERCESRVNAGVMTIAPAASRHGTRDAMAVPRREADDRRVAPATQKVRDDDSRAVLQAELAHETERLTRLKASPAVDAAARRAIERSEADVAALQRELSRLR